MSDTRGMTRAKPAHMPPPDHHDALDDSTARAAVFGVSDGLVTNVSLILGVAGATTSADVVRLAGVASLLAGAFSMAAGEYISVTAQRELVEAEIARERHELKVNPEGERVELAQLYVSRGVAPDVAEQIASDLMRDPDLALQTHAREELGVDPESLGSARAAAISSFLTFAVGAFLPLVPWLFIGGSSAILWSMLIGGISALAIGAGLAQFTGRSVVKSALRQLLVATVAAGITYGVGVTLGVSVG